MVFASGWLAAEARVPDSPIDSYGHALYWGVAAFSTAGLNVGPITGGGRLIGGVWIVLGSVLFLGTIVGTVTAYFMRPLSTPAHQIVDTIEDNLQRLDELSTEDLDLLRKTVDGLIDPIEEQKSDEASGENDNYEVGNP